MDLSVPYVPIDDIDPPWDETISNLNRRIFALANPTPSQICLSEWSSAVWGIALHWAYKKKWNSKHKVPGNRVEAKAIEPFAEVLVAFLELAIQTHAIPSDYSAHYPHAADWFRMASPAIRVLCFGESSSKSDLIDRIRHVRQYLAEFKNPFPEHGIYLHLWRLAEAAIEIARGNDRYHDLYWRGKRNWKPNQGHSRGVLNALSAWATELKTNEIWVNAAITKKGLHAQSGQGKGKISLDSKNRSPKALIGRQYET